MNNTINRLVQKVPRPGIGGMQMLSQLQYERKGTLQNIDNKRVKIASNPHASPQPTRVVVLDIGLVLQSTLWGVSDSGAFLLSGTGRTGGF